MIPPLYCALVEQALDEAGVLEPVLTADGRFLESGGRNLLEADDGVRLAVQALAMADAVHGAGIGREVVQRLAKAYRVEGLERAYDDLRDAHGFDPGWIVDAFKRAARVLVPQQSI